MIKMETQGKILMKRYWLGKFLGQGSFAKVYHAKRLETGENVAIKTIDKARIVKAAMEPNVEREVTMMRTARHPNVVRLQEVMASKKRIYLVLEYVRGGELFTKLKQGKFDEDGARKYFRQLISAVDFCHSRGVYHRDLKPENLLLDDDENLKVTDFGLGALNESKRQDGFLHTTCGTPAYVAPEVYRKHGYEGAKADIWSCGVILFVLLAGYLPFRGANEVQIYRKMMKGDIQFPSWFSSGARRLLSEILQPDPKNRISIRKIRKSSWFRKGGGSAANQEPAEEEVVENPALPQPSYMNAFDIISLSKGLDVAAMFGEEKKESRFTSLNTAKTIVSKLEEVAKRLRLRFVKKERGLVTLKAAREGRKGVVSIDAEVFEFTPEFHMVEFNKSSGDTFEYRKMMKREIRPALKDIVWTWQGEAEPQQQQKEDEPKAEEEPAEAAEEAEEAVGAHCA